MKPFLVNLSLGLLFVAFHSSLQAQVKTETCNQHPTLYMAATDKTQPTQITLNSCDISHGEIILAIPYGKNMNFNLSLESQLHNNVNLLIESDVESFTTYAFDRNGKLLVKSIIKDSSLTSIELENKRRGNLIKMFSQQLNLVKFNLKNFTVSPIIFQSLLLDKTRVSENSQPMRYIELRPASAGLELSLRDKSGPRAELSGGVGPGFFLERVVNSDEPNKIQLSPTLGVNVKLTIRLGK